MWVTSSRPTVVTWKFLAADNMFLLRYSISELFWDFNAISLRSSKCSAPLSTYFIFFPILITARNVLFIY